MTMHNPRFLLHVAALAGRGAFAAAAAVCLREAGDGDSDERECANDFGHEMIFPVHLV